MNTEECRFFLDESFGFFPASGVFLFLLGVVHLDWKEVLKGL